MGLKDFDTTPETRGRSSSSSSKDREPDGDPMTMRKSRKPVWQALWDEFVDGKKPSDGEIAAISDHTHLLPKSVKESLEEHGIHDFGMGDWTGEKTTESDNSGTSDSGSSKFNIEALK